MASDCLATLHWSIQNQSQASLVSAGLLIYKLICSVLGLHCVNWYSFSDNVTSRHHYNHRDQCHDHYHQHQYHHHHHHHHHHYCLHLSIWSHVRKLLEVNNNLTETHFNDVSSTVYINDIRKHYLTSIKLWSNICNFLLYRKHYGMIWQECGWWIWHVCQ